METTGGRSEARRAARSSSTVEDGNVGLSDKFCCNGAESLEPATLHRSCVESNGERRVYNACTSSEAIPGSAT